MSFLQIKRSSVYLQIDANPKPIRPLVEKPTGVWINLIPSCTTTDPSGKLVTIRQFRTVNADLPCAAWMKKNPDPLWDRLDQMDRHNRQGQRVDFPSRPQHILPVWSYSDNDVRIVKQGNQFYDEMVKYSDTGGNVTNCDWICWTEGKGRQTQYKTSRQDISPFKVQIDPAVLQQKVQAAIEQAMNDLNPFKDIDDMLKHIHGVKAQEAAAFQYGANQPQLQAPVPASLPAYTPGGPTNLTLGVSQTVVTPVPTMATPAQTMPSSTPNVYPPTTAPAQYQQGSIPSYGPQAIQAQQQIAQPVYQPQSQPQAYVPQQVQAPPQGMVAPQPAYYTQPTSTQTETVPNAPIMSTPVFAPPVTSQPGTPVPVQVMPNSDPASYVVDKGKHQGKTLGWLKDNEPGYLNYLKANKKELTPLIEAVLGAGGQSQAMAQPPMSEQAQKPQTDETEFRSYLVKDIMDKVFKIPEFQGAGIQTNMTPFIKSITGGPTQLDNVPTDKLQLLKSAIDQKLGV